MPVEVIFCDKKRVVFSRKERIYETKRSEGV